MNHESGKKKRSLKGATKEEQRIIDLLQDQSLHFVELVIRSGFSPSQVGIVLSFMEVKGIIKSLESKSFGLTN